MAAEESILTAGDLADAGRMEARGAWPAGRIGDFLSRPAVYGSLIPGMSLLTALAGLMVPMLITPVVFAQYALVVTFFQYGLIFDLGASQLADRLLPAFLGRGEDVAAEAFGQQLLWFRVAVGTGSFVLVAAGMAIFAAAGRLPFDLTAGLLSAFAGLVYMVALGPACIYRARAQRRNYAVGIAALSSGLVFARIGGLALGGVAGCFAALAAWYCGFAAVFTRLMPPRLALRPTAQEMAALAVKGAPLFATSFLWVFYTTSNRWFASSVVTPDDFVPFAFGANILTLLVGAVGGISALWYPAILQNLARDGRQAGRRITRDVMVLVGVATLLSAGGAVSAALGIRLLFPHFVDAVPTVRVFLVAMPALALSSWLMPVSLSAGRRPWIDGVVLYPVATLVLAACLLLLYHPFGVAGAAWASAASANVLTAMQLLLLADAAVLSVRDIAAVEGISILATFALNLLVLALQ